MENETSLSKVTGLDRTVDSNDPLANFFRNTLKLNWASLWFIALLYLGPFEKLLLPALGGYLSLNVGIRDWNPHVEAMLTGFIEFPALLAFYLWSGTGVVKLFDEMRWNKSFTDLDAYDAFVDRALKSFRSKVWPLIGLVVGILAAAVMHFVVWSENAQVPPWFDDRPGMRALTLFNIGVMAYTVIQSLIREGLVISWLNRLWRELGDQLDIHPYHEDQAGGLAGVGRHTVVFLFFVVILMLFILMATILPGFLEQGSTGESIPFRLWSPILVGIWVSYLIVIPCMVFLLIWPAHNIMLTKRAESLNIYSIQLDDLVDKAAQYTTEDPKKFVDVLTMTENLKKMRAQILEDFPVWPLSHESTRMLGFTSSLPTLYSAVMYIVSALS
jgi:hypothetical protein